MRRATAQGMIGQALATVVFAGLSLLATTAARSEDSTVAWAGVERVVAFADVHGAYEEMTTLLRSGGVVDAGLRWSGGKTHVVSLGDLLDRGADSRKVMDLLMRLQGEAATAGGRLHVVLGNHEAMNVLGDLRYVDPGEYAAYAAEEDPAERTQAKAAFLARQAGTTEADFERLFPPGYFGHRRMLGPEGRYGRWILSLPVAVKVNDTVYMHGGPSAVLGGRSLEQLNRDYRAALQNYLAAEDALRKAGLLQFEDVYSRRPDAAAARVAAMPPGEAAAALAPLVERFRVADDEPLLGSRGPNWSRGVAFCNECAEADVLRPWLQAMGAVRVVVGHTVARDGTVVSRFDGAVVKLDAGMNRAVYKGHPAMLFADASGTRVAYVLPDAPPAAIPAEPLFLSSQAFGEDVVETILAKGTIAVAETCAPGVHEVRVTHDGRAVEAVFEAAPPDVVKRELAAYRLDRLLGLGLVPATVARNHGGQDGILQGRPANWASEQDRLNAKNGTAAGLACQTISTVPQAEPARRAPPANGRPPRLPTGGWCDMGALYQLSYAFDALIDNKGRSFDRFLYDADQATLFLVGHGAAFGTSSQVPKPLEAPLAKTGAEMRSRLQRLDEASVESAIGDLIGSRSVKALLARRDRILAIASTPAPAAR
jgi:Calcineurin-like phosphoesterase